MFTRHSAFHFPQRLIFVIGIATLFLSLVAPVLSLQAVALQEDAPRCEDGFAFNEDTGGCDPEIPQVNAKRIDPSLVQQPTELPPDCERGMVFSPDADGCVPDPDLEPTADPVEPTQAPPECEDDFVFNVETGGCDPVPVTKEPTRVVIDPTQEPVEPTRESEPTVAEKTREPEEPTEPDDGSATVNITAWVCAEGSKLDPKAASAEELAKACVRPLAGVGLEVLTNGEPFTRAETGEDGQFQVGDVPAGELTVIQHTPEGYSFGAWVTTLYPDGRDGESLPPTIGLEPDPNVASLDPDILADIDIFYFWDISITVESYWCPNSPTNGGFQTTEVNTDICWLTGPTTPGTTLTLIGLGKVGPWGWPATLVPGTPGAVTSWTGLPAFEDPYEISESNLVTSVWSSEVRCREQGSLTTTSDEYVTQPNVGTGSTFTIQLDAQIGVDWECKWFHFRDNSIWLHNYHCANAPISTTTASDVHSTCNPSPGLNVGFAFTHSDGSDYKLTSASQKSDGGLVVFQIFADGGVTLTKDPEQGFGESLVYCGGHGWEGGSYVALDDVQIAPDNNGTVSLAVDVNSIYSQTTVSCSWFSIPGQSQIPSDSTVVPEPTVPQTFVTVPAPVDQNLIPNEPVDDEAHPPEPVLPGTLALSSLSCPEEVDFEVVAVDELAELCTDAASGVEIGVMTESESVQRGITGDGGNLQLNVPEGEFSLIAQPLAEEQTMSLACASFPEWEQGTELPSFNAGEPVPEPWLLATESGLIQCHLYLEFVQLDNGDPEPAPTQPPDPTPGHLFLFVKNCPSSVSMTDLTYSAQLANISCPGTVAGDEFTLTDSTNTQTPGSVGDDGGTGNNPVTSWANIPEGPFTISQAPQSGYESKVVWCNSYRVLGEGYHVDHDGPNLITIVNESFQLEVDPWHEYFECSWYNLPTSGTVAEPVVTIPALADDDFLYDPGPLLVLTALGCAEEVDVAEAAGDELASSCAEPVAGVGISISANGEPFTRGSTNDTGRLKVGVPSGELLLTAVGVSEGQGAVACASFPEWQAGDELPGPMDAEPIPQPWSFDFESGLLQCQLYLGASVSGDAGASGSFIRAFRAQRGPTPTATELVVIGSDPA